MIQSLQDILNRIKQSDLSDADKAALEKVVQAANKEFEMVNFKLDRTEKVKRTTAILLEETIQELELKRKAVENQNHELEIETALERVRAIALSMQDPKDMLAVCRTIADQLHWLGVKEIRNVQTAIIYESKGTYLNFEYYAKHDQEMVTEVQYDNHPMSIDFVKRMLEDPNGFYTSSLNRDELLAWYNFQKTTNQFADTYLENANSLNYYWNSAGPVALGISTYSPLSVEQVELFKRFRNVFGLAYRRYLDIETAQAQAREARIEAALERIRSRSLAMHNTNELQDVVNVMAQQLLQMNIDIDGGLFIAINDELTDDLPIWASAGATDYVSKVTIPSLDSITYTRLHDGILNREAFFTEYYTKEEKNIFLNHLFQHHPWNQNSDERKAELLERSGGYARSVSVSRYTAVGITNHHGKKFSDADHVILKRFGAVLEQSYVRFLDLQKAEKQAREAQIEAALERVRSKAMAMHQSEDLVRAVSTVFEELDKLAIGLLRSGIGILNHEDMRANVWMTVKTESGLSSPVSGDESMDTHPLLRAAYQGWLNQQEVSYTLEGDEIRAYYQSIRGENLSIPEWQQSGEVSVDLKQYYHCAMFQSGGMFAFSNKPFSNEAKSVLKRFADVFNLTYRRFLDLQKAESQAREAKIETALERVRSKTMAMQKSDELPEVSAELYRQLKGLGEPIQQLTIGVIHEAQGIVEISATVEGNILPQTVRHPIEEPYVMQKIVNSWKDGDKVFILDLKGEEISAYNNFRNQLIGKNLFPVDLNPESHRVITAAMFSKGILALAADEPRPAESVQVLERFAGVFDLTYTRFLDLQKAEAQAKESQIEAALERVRSRTLAMQKSDELAETAAVLFRQLITLGIQPNRLYITIIKDENDAEFWITDEDGSRVSSAFHANMMENETFIKMYDGWKTEKKTIIIDMHGEELENYFRYLTSINVPFKGGLEQKRRVQHIAYFSKGFIGMASPDEQPAETMQLLERFASVFNLTFTRFNDLIIAEQHALQAEQDLQNLIAEKKRTEEALHELRATQTQLIQAEKMASLGELTAGIAHEIQNPLNFVNNFSEVNSELIEELKDELAKGNTALANELAENIKENEEKIVFHGKRADGIVKSMLLHSRTGSGQKELTDINAMADEYLRLAYHGMRAKDKSFNVDYKLDLDPELSKIMVMPQEIGRVFLNLINNAFQALASAPKSPKGDFLPTVKVITKRKSPSGDLGAGVEILISDNGPGIPDAIKDKIFQPFFTTKPAGQGTGLGLSLSYDIIKAHGGEIKVETKEGEGTTFTIYLPQT